MPAPHRPGRDEESDRARRQGAEYRGRETRAIPGRRLPRRFREMVEADEDA